MRQASRNRGFGLLVALVTLGVAAALLATVTVQMAGLIDRSSRFAREVRARALAEAGVEAALALKQAPQSLDFPLDGGRCRVKFVRDSMAFASGGAESYTIASEGSLPSAGGWTRYRIIVHVIVDASKTLHIEGRTESVEHVRVSVPAAK